ncbi:putative 3-demethylubiquinone-9 3-methyltransferase [Trypanosoma cruzi]|uniref:Ubiquinone biosynthesis O-methyltransferase, mitochondrial n=2 Tax=Trypanosoma cruzi TaxID=5693 RepID=Q4E4W2_TRYCC|nr:3-demethylubiquinone-9 3-methyltransferase, putative [Trypanosoma cruzi]EAN99813.1 3-demethylubiquinone-9 3-methyltransferase, putative [Trypanosoma cruzi]PWV22072.1 putative 3-demethylubiquinone-9 3-methyltransferase [Trypanosoma cruzi]RNC49772.1 3-demethylubiquinone-9 3-methyltransferase [Trypanosoma cruzi]|eukprot:XP_821664.1 3-demethylubiquinone-9 3-methyltransferase [Trypanosoma cruzi strain CL Brener]
MRGVSAAEIGKFRELQNHWWNPDGPLRTLHFFNPLRVKYINDTCRNFSKRSSLLASSGITPGMRILDVGCGGGILSESLVRLGGNVLGIDMCEESIAVAQQRREQVLQDVASCTLQNGAASLEYRYASLNTIAVEEKQQFDLVVASEVIEHVDDAPRFLQDLCDATKPGGLLIISTMDKSIRAAISHIAVAEYLTALVRPGTHDWSKFVPPKDLSRCALQHQVRQVDLQYIVACPNILMSLSTRQMQLAFSLSKRFDTGHYFWSGLKVTAPA